VRVRQPRTGITVLMASATLAAAGCLPAGAAAAASSAPAVASGLISRTFTFTGQVQSMDIPAGTTSVQITAIGGHGGGSRGGDAASITADIPVSGAGITLQVRVGGPGQLAGTRPGGGGWNGGGNGADDGNGGGR
jgi:hypothetical protein